MPTQNNLNAVQTQSLIDWQIDAISSKVHDIVHLLQYTESSLCDNNPMAISDFRKAQEILLEVKDDLLKIIENRGKK